MVFSMLISVEMRAHSDFFTRTKITFIGFWRQIHHFRIFILTRSQVKFKHLMMILIIIITSKEYNNLKNTRNDHHKTKRSRNIELISFSVSVTTTMMQLASIRGHCSRMNWSFTKEKVDFHNHSIDFIDFPFSKALFFFPFSCKKNICSNLQNRVFCCLRGSLGGQYHLRESPWKARLAMAPMTTSSEEPSNLFSVASTHQRM